VEEEKEENFLDSMNNALKGDYGAIPQRTEGDRASLTQGEEAP